MSHDPHGPHKKHKRHQAAHHEPQGPPPVPIWFLSFGDMITNMLTFYILMVTLAQTQEAGFVGAGTGSVLNAAGILGSPGSLRAPKPISKGSPAPNFALSDRHVVKDPDGPAKLTPLATPPNDRLKKATVDYEPSGRDVALPTPIAFLPGTAELTPDSTRHLDFLAELAQQRLAHVTVEAHVSGLDDGWALSALRAAAIARYLHQHADIPYGRITLAGHGRFHPIANGIGTSLQANDRVNILLSSRPPE